MVYRWALTIAIVLAAAAPAAAQSAKPACAATDTALPAALAAWTAAKPIAAGTEAPATLAVGAAATAALKPGGAVRYAVAPEKPGKAGSFGGLLAFDVARAGTYRVALSAPAWVDVVRGGKAVTSIAHGHGPDCSTIRKIVDFPLTPGRYVMQLAGSPTASATVLVTAKR